MVIRKKALAAILVLVVMAMIARSSPSTAQPAIAGELAPGGKLRTGLIGVGVVKDVGEPLAGLIAERIGLPHQSVVYPTSTGFATSVGKDEWDVAIGGRVFAVPEKADILGNLYAVELVYAVAPQVEISSAEGIDRPGVKIGVVEGSPSDRFITRTLKSGTVVRVPLSGGIGEVGKDLLESRTADVLAVDAGIAHDVLQRLPGARMLPGVFETVPIAVLLPKGRSAGVQARVREIVADMKASGAVQRAIDASGHKGLRVAP